MQRRWNARIEACARSIAQLQSAAYGGGGLRQQLQNQYDVYRCRGRGPPDFIERLFGGRDQIVYPPAGPPDDGAIMEPQQDNTPRGGSEAVCVRTCDGSFFPVSLFGAARRPRRPSRKCARRNVPAAEVKLFTRAPRDMNTAVSIDGDSYTNLENAFKYEKQVVPNCACRKPGQSWAEALVDAEKLLGEGRKGDIIVTPEKAEELSRPQQPGNVPAAKGKSRKGKAAAFDPQAMKKLLEAGGSAPPTGPARTATAAGRHGRARRAGKRRGRDDHRPESIFAATDGGAAPEQPRGARGRRAKARLLRTSGHATPCARERARGTLRRTARLHPSRSGRTSPHGADLAHRSARN